MAKSRLDPDLGKFLNNWIKIRLKVALYVYTYIIVSMLFRIEKCQDYGPKWDSHW